MGGELRLPRGLPAEASPFLTCRGNMARGHVMLLGTEAGEGAGVAEGEEVRQSAAVTWQRLLRGRPLQNQTLTTPVASFYFSQARGSVGGPPMDSMAVLPAGWSGAALLHVTFTPSWDQEPNRGNGRGIRE